MRNYRAFILLVFAVFLFFANSCVDDQTASQEDKSQDKMENVTTSKATLTVSGMTCDGCVNAIETALSEQEGVIDCEVSLEKSTAKIQFNSEKVNRDKLVAVVTEAGYKAEVIK